MPDPEPLRPGDPTRVGGYTLQKRLGEGGHGVVYLGVRDDVRAAVKVLRDGYDQLDSVRTRLDGELGNLRKVPRAFAVGVLDAGIDGEHAYLATEYIEGDTLQDLVRQGQPFAGRALLTLAYQTVSGLTAIHPWLVHRDIKPNNIMRARDGWVVIDYGVARAASLPSAGHGFEGTLTYAAPEQLEGNYSDKSDMFAWAGTMVFAATGKPPFIAQPGNPWTLVNLIRDTEPELDGLAAVDARLAKIVRQCLDKDPGRRPTAHRVQKWLEEREDATIPLPSHLDLDLPPALPPARSRRWTVPALALVTVLALAIAGVAVWRAETRKPPAPVMSAELSTFAAGLPVELFQRQQTRGSELESWGFDFGNVHVSLVEYATAASLAGSRTRTAGLSLPKGIPFRRGTGRNRAQQLGPYLEYMVHFDAADGGGDWASLWWDSSESNPGDRCALIMRTPWTADHKDDLNRLRGVWQGHSYAGP